MKLGQVLSRAARRAWSQIRASFVVDMGLVTPVVGCITALPVVAVFVAGIAIDDTNAAIAMAIGANLIAIASLVAAPRLPIGLALADAFAMGFSAFVGSITNLYPWLHDVVLIPWCFGAGMLVAFGATQATIGTQAIIAFVAFGRFGGTPLSSTRLGALVTAGALIEVGALLLLRLPPSLRFQRSHLASAFENLAGLVRRDAERPTEDVARVLDSAERTLSSRSLFGRADARVLQSALNQARRIRLEISNLAGVRSRLSSHNPPHVKAQIETILDLASDTLVEIGEGFRHPRYPSSWKIATSNLQEAVAGLDKALGSSTGVGTVIIRESVLYLVALAGQLRAAGNLMEEARMSPNHRARRPRVKRTLGTGSGRSPVSFEAIVDNGRIWRATFVENLDLASPSLRHAIRLAVSVPLSAAIALWLSLPRGYWVPFSVAVILRPDYRTLLSRGVGRLIGTLLGATLAAVIVSELHPGRLGTSLLLGIIAWAAYSTWAANFAVSIGFVTALVLVLLSTSLSDSVTTAVDRLIDVAIGGAMAIGAYLIWPTSASGHVAETQSRLFSAQRDYLAAVLRLLKGSDVDATVLSNLARTARQAWAAAEDAVGASTFEPAPTKVDPAIGRALLASGIRIVRAIHSLRIGAELGSTVAGSTELDDLGDGLLSALDLLAQRFDSEERGAMPELRRLYLRAQSVLVTTGAPEAVPADFDELVNAIDTAAHFAGIEPSSMPTGGSHA